MQRNHEKSAVASTSSNGVLGRFGEDAACAHLEASGMRILDRNWRCRDGEIDAVVLDGAVLAFVEVKTRSTTGFGDPAEAVTPVKAARLRRLAIRWLADQRDGDEPLGWTEIRFDVVSVLRRGPGAPIVRHLPGAF